MINRFSIKLLNTIGLTIVLLLLACNSDANPFDKKDRWLRYKAHHSILPQKPNWKRASFKQTSYFGRYKYSADAFHDYGGDPYGPIVAIWQVARYLGEEPKTQVCKEPEAPYKIAKRLGVDSTEFKVSNRNYVSSLKNFKACQKNQIEIEEQATTYSHYYARSADNYVVVAPKRVKNHASYEINASFGPKIAVSTQGLTAENLAIKESLYYANCRLTGDPNADQACYRLPGEDHNLYYNIRSLLTEPKQSEVASSPYQQTPLITSDPVKWEEIKGIKITKTQYEWLEKRCVEHVFNCYMDNTAPDLTPEQQAYIKATAWELDNDYEKRDIIGEGANDFRVHQ